MPALLKDEEMPALIPIATEDRPMPALVRIGSYSRSFKEWMTHPIIKLGKSPRICYVGNNADVLEGWKCRRTESNRGFDTDAFFLSCRVKLSREFLTGLVLPLTMQDHAQLFVCDHVLRDGQGRCEPERCAFREMVDFDRIKALVNSPRLADMGWPDAVIVMRLDRQ